MEGVVNMPLPALKLLLRRTLATSTMIPYSASIISPCTTPFSSLYTYTLVLAKTRPTLANGPGCACLGSIPSAHVNKNISISTTTTTTHNNNITNTSTRKNKLYILSPQHSSSSSSSSSSSFLEEERETSERKLEMGFENHKQNGVVECRHQNGAVDCSSDRNHQQNDEQCTKLLTLPTVLTLARVAAIPVFIATFYVNSWWGPAATTSIFVAAAITDWLDGYLARKMHLGTAFGAFLDPVADKLMVAATLVLLCSRPPETSLLGDVPWLFPVPAIAIIGREITMSAVREWAASQNQKLLQAVAVNNLGKWKTATQMTALTILVASQDTSLAGSGTLVTSGAALLYISAGLAIWSLVVYMRKIWKVLLT